MERKTVSLELKADDEGSFRAVFSSFDVIDKDGDVTRKGAFTSGQAVRIAQWGHNWGALPVGRGALASDDSKAWVDGKFFLDVTAGADTYRTVKNLGELQEWSYGFNVKKWSRGEFDGQEVRFLEEVEVFEVSPVMIGAGVGTHTEFVKGHQSLEEEDAAALAAVAGFHDRVKALAAVRAKEGRTLSGANRDRLKRHLDLLAEIRADIETLLTDTAPDPKSFDPLAEYVRFEALRARRLGVAVI